jgi:hypothetical protein
MENFDHYLPQLEALVKSGSTDNIDLAIEIAKTFGLYDDLMAPWRELWKHMYFSADTERNLLCETLNLKELSIFSSELIYFPKVILLMSNLKELEIYNTKLSEIPAELASLKNLTKLNLSNNCIKCVPEEILQMLSLELIDLSDNYLTNLPVLASNIQELNISANSFESTPDALLNDNNLSVLIMCNNPGFEWDLSKLDLNRLIYLYAEQTAIKLEGLYNRLDIKIAKDEHGKITRLFGKNFHNIPESSYQNSWNLFDFSYEDYDCEFIDYLWTGPDDYKLNDYLEDESHKCKEHFRIRNLNINLKSDS